MYWGTPRMVVYDYGNKKKPDLIERLVYPARPFAFSFCDDVGNTDYVRCEIDPFSRRVLNMSKSDRDAIQEVVGDPNVVKIAHNARYDLGMYEHAGFTVRGPVYDTMILSHVATSGRELTYALKPLTKKYLEFSMDDESDLMKATHAARRQAKKLKWAFATEVFGGREPAKADIWMADRELCRDYAVKDTERCMLLWHLWYDEIQNDPDMKALFDREHEVFWVLKSMEDRGTRVFPETVHELKTYYEGYKVEQIRLAEANGGAGLNYNSPKQMSQKFYVERGHKPKYTEKGNFQLNGEKLLELAEVDPLAKAVLEFKAADQTISSFLDVYERYWVPAEDNPDVWVLHPNYRQCGTITGRLSCSDPNLMQVASATTGRRKADIQSRPREAFGPRPGCYWYLPDYSQIEVWLFAFLSGEKKMQEALLSGKDFHGTIAGQVYSARTDFEENHSYYRKCAKLIMFCKLYGGGVSKIQLLLKTKDSWVCTECGHDHGLDTAPTQCEKCWGPVRLQSGYDKAADFVRRWEAELPGVKVFMKRLVNRAMRDGEIRNPFGRRYQFEEDFAYKSVNYLIQGTAADVMKNALVYVNNMLREKWDGIPRILLTIHDELAIEVPRGLHSKRLMRDIIEAMQRDSTRLGIPVPLPVGMKIVKPGDRWHQTHEIDLIQKAA